MGVQSLRIPFVGSLLTMLCSAALVGQASVDTAATVGAAEKAAQAWLAIVDKGDIAKSWDEGAVVFQLAVTQDKWEKAVKGARGPFEPFGARRRIMARYTTEPPNAPPGQYVLLQYSTKVSGGRQVVETVVPVLDGKRGWRVSGYWVRLDQ
jgi:hypothetical protein